MKYWFLLLVTQIVGCALIWVAVLILSPALDSFFEKLVFFYWPAIILVGKILGTSGESAMIAVPVYGMGLGTIFYSAIIGFFVNYIKTRNR